MVCVQIDFDKWPNDQNDQTTNPPTPKRPTHQTTKNDPKIVRPVRLKSDYW